MRRCASLCGVSADWITRTTGVEKRYWVANPEHEHAGILGAAAAREALSEARLNADEVDLLIAANGSSIQAIPDDAAFIAQELGISGVACYRVHATCLSFLIALQQAGLYLAQYPQHKVLIVTAEIASPFIDPSDPKSFGLFGDSAAAAVVTGEGGGRIQRYLHRCWPQEAGLAELRAGGTRYGKQPTPADLLFSMQGKKLLRATLRHLAPFLEELAYGDPARLACAIAHQPSRAGLRVMHQIGFTPSQVINTLATQGNCIAASLPSTLYHARRAGRLRRGDEFVLLGSGAGLALAGALLEY